MKYSLHYSLKQFFPKRKMPLGVIHMSRGLEAKKKFHNHNYSEIVLILGGSGIHLFEDQRCRIKAGDVLIVHPEVFHAYDHEDLELINIVYDARQLMLPVLDGASMPLFRKIFPDGLSNFRGQAEPVLTLGPEEREIILSRILDMGTELKSSRSGCDFRSLALFMEIIVALCREYQENDQEQDPSLLRIGETAEYMNMHYQKPITIGELAKKACMSRRNYFLHFRKSVGCSPIQYLIRLRISRATELLLYTEMRIGDIAARCGFPDSNYFCKTFRAQTGVSPRQYRLNNRT